MARSEPALTALVGAMVGLAIAVAAVLAERQSSAGAAGVTAGVSADLVAGVGAGIDAGQGGSAEAMSWRPPAWRVGTLAGSRVLRSPGCAGAARFGLEHGNRQPAPLSAGSRGQGSRGQVLPLACLLSL